MGQELDCTMHYKRRAHAGRAMLETDYLLFRGEERLKLMFRDLTGVTAADGVLELQFDGGPATFDLGKAATKWADKILHPPSRLDKLGIKEGSAVRLLGAFDEAFPVELRERKAKVEGTAAITCFAAASAAGLKRVPTLAKAMKPKDALWIVYPKGVPVIREIDVIQAGRTAGLKDVKVASFSSSHTGLKFVK
jgi:hypothetical protein